MYSCLRFLICAYLNLHINVPTENLIEDAIIRSFNDGVLVCKSLFE